MTEREALHSKLLKRVTFFKPKSTFAKDTLDLALAILSAHGPEDTPEPQDILDGVRESFPPARTVFTDQFFSSPLFPVTFLRDTMDLYSATPLTDLYLQRLNLPDGVNSNTNIMALAWLSSLLYLSPRQALDIIQTYGLNCLPTGLLSPRVSTGDRSASNPGPSQINQSAQASPPPSENSETDRRIQSQEDRINDLTELVQRISASPQNIDPAAQHHQGNNGLNANLDHSRNRRPTQQNDNASYGSVGFIPQLPFRRTERPNASGGASLLKVYGHSSQQFSGYGDIEENLAVFHQTFMSKCRTLQLTESEAFDTLHVLFRPNSPASIFYHKHVQPAAKNLDEAFKMLYNRFLSAERRDRLISEWNNLRFSSFESKPGATKHSALRDMCVKASMIQLQLGPSYQDDQHLRDALMNACKYEDWAHRLATMPTNALLDVQEALARAITAEENLRSAKSKSSSVAAFANDINFNDNGYRNRSLDRANDRSGMASRRYGRDTKFNNRNRLWKDRRAPDGKNPIRNHMRMLCRNCDSDSHLLRDCDKLTSTHKALLAKHILCVESICSDSEDCLDAMDMIQDFDDERWNQLEVLYSSSAESDTEPEPNETNFSSTSDSQSDISTSLFSALSDVSFSHSLIPGTPVSESSNHNQILFNERTRSPEFEGICMDHGAQKSLSGLPAYRRYCGHSHTSLDLFPSNESFKLGSVIHKSLGKTMIRMPIDCNGNYLEYETDVINVDIPILFGLDKMKQLRWHINEVTNEFCSFDDPQLKVKLQYEKGHLYLKWPSSLVLFTRNELIKVHRRFAHPSALKLTELIRRADPDGFDSSTRKILEDITAHCNSCQRMAPKPYVFQVTMPDKIVFNHEIYLDLTWVEQRPHPPALHIVDRGTHLSAAQFVKSESAESIWNAFLSCWVSVYIGFPNILSHDQGALFISSFFKETCAKFGIITKESPTESHNSLGPGERYHAPLRKIYRKIKIEYPTLDSDTALSIAVYGLNNSANPEGLVPTLLVFGAIPKIPLGNVSHLPANQRERFRAMETSRKQMESIVAQQRLKLASKKHKGKAMNVFEVCPGSDVLVYREKKKCWEGPFKLAHYDNYKTAYVNINGDIKPFSITAVKQYLREASRSGSNENLQSKSQNPTIGDRITVYWPHDAQYYPGAVQSYDSTQKSYRIAYDDGDIEDLDLSNEKWKYVNDNDPANEKSVNLVIVSNPLDPRFINSSKLELKGLLDRGACIPIMRNNIPFGSTILRSRVIHSIKNIENGSPKFKTRLVVMGHTDPDKGRVVNEAPTILRSSLRIILSICATMEFELWTRDVTQAFLQSADALNRQLFVLLPNRPELHSLLRQILNESKNENDRMYDNQNEELALKVLQPWYGLCESPSYWWQTFKRYHVHDLGMSQISLDPCFFFKKRDGKLIGIVGTLVDDTLGSGSLEFVHEEKEKSSRFDAKPQTTEFPFSFNGLVVDKNGKTISIRQSTYTDSIKALNSKNFTAKDFAHARGQLAYVATSTRPDISFLSAQLAQIVSSNATEKDVKLLNSAIKQAKSTRRGLLFPKLELETMRIHGYADASFANNTDLSSQLGMVVTLVDKNGNASIVHYASWKCRRITRSVLAAEVYALSECYDYCYAISNDLSRVIGQKIPIHLFTDSKSIFDTVTKLSTVSEKRLLIDISALRQSYASAEIENIGHVLSEHNIADALTKRKNSELLNRLLDTGKLVHPVNQWIIHDRSEFN